MSKRMCGTSRLKHGKHRQWKALPQNQVKRIRDTAEGNIADASTDDIYNIASELLHFRFLQAELDHELDGVAIPASAAAIINALRHRMQGID